MYHISFMTLVLLPEQTKAVQYISYCVPCWYIWVALRQTFKEEALPKANTKANSIKKKEGTEENNIHVHVHVHVHVC